jgi:6-phosphogluconolactonase
MAARTYSFALSVAMLGPGMVHAQSDQAKEPLIAYVGTFSSPLRDVLPTQVDLPPGNGRGIHLFQVNRATGAMTPAGVREMGTSPSCLALNAAGTRLYSANETDRTGKGQEGTVSAFAINPADGQLKLLNTVPSGGAGPTYVSVHPSGRFLLVANYFGGSVAVLPILADGRLGAASDVKNPTGKIGPAKATNAPPGSFAFSGHDRTHAHMIQSDPSGRFVLHIDLGLDKIFVWKLDEARGALTANDPPAVSLPPGDGPRHFHFHPNGRWFYSIQEEGSTVVLFDFDAQGGRLTPRQTISTLPPGFAGSNFCSEILVSADGKFVYAGNRLHDSIGIFSIGADGALNYIGEEWTRGNYPRSFTIDPTGQFLYCCNQRGDNVAVFRVDRKTGGLAFTGHYAGVGNPSIVVFLDLQKGSLPDNAAENAKLARSLTLHASFDKGLDADFSRGDKTCYAQGQDLLPAKFNDDVKLAAGAGRFGGALHFPNKGNTRPSFKDAGVLGYNAKSWSASVSAWLRLSPDQDLQPGYCDPIQIVGNDAKKGYIFLEWSKDDNPRLFRYAIRPLFPIWNPNSLPWDAIPIEKRPAVQVARAPFARDKWTHVAFTLENINDKAKPQGGTLYINGKRQGAIEKWDLTFDWDPAKVLLVLGASYVGHVDDLAVFDRPLTDAEVERIYGLKNGIRELYP